VIGQGGAMRAIDRLSTETRAAILDADPSESHAAVAARLRQAGHRIPNAGTLVMHVRHAAGILEELSAQPALTPAQSAALDAALAMDLTLKVLTGELVIDWRAGPEEARQLAAVAIGDLRVLAASDADLVLAGLEDA
jgi:hypothetical protein